MDYKADLSPEQKLDVVLQKVVNTSEQARLNYKFITAMVVAEGYEKEIFEILLKLVKDGYILCPDGEYYVSNFDGRLFIDNGGYTKKKKIDLDATNFSSLTLTRDKTYRNRLLWATWCAGIAAVFLLLWQVWIWFYPVHVDYPYWYWQTIPSIKK